MTWAREYCAVAGDVGGVDASHAGWIAAAATAVGAAIGAFGLWLANRMLGEAAFQTVINTGFNQLLDQQRKLHEAERAAWKEELDRERIERAAERAQHTGEIINVAQALESLKSYLRRNGLDVPELHTPAADFVMLDKKP